MTSQYVQLVLALPALRSRTTRAKSQSWNFSNVSAKREASESAKREITTRDVQYGIVERHRVKRAQSLAHDSNIHGYSDQLIAEQVP